MATFEKQSPKLVKVSMNGQFAGWLEQSSRRSTGLHSERFTFWSGRVCGTDVSATTLTAAKAKISSLCA
jgi:hypothetical protein